MIEGGRFKLAGCLLSALVFALGVCAPARSADVTPGTKDPKAVAITAAMQDAMGGLANWQKVDFIRYDFIVEHDGKTVFSRSHLWNKQTGDYRLEEKTKDGKSEVVLFNINTRQGSAYLDGKKVEGADSAKDVKDAYAAFVNDSWWLDMPWNWMNEGVNLKYLGVRKRGNETDDVVQLTFNHVGLTPGDMYHAFVSRSSHLMTHWDYVLQSHQKGSWNWEWTETNGIKLPSTHVSADGQTRISMGHVEVLDSVDPSYFSDASHMLAAM